MFKVDNKNTRTTSLMLFCCFYCLLWTYFTPFFSVFIVDFEQVNVTWEGIHLFKVRWNDHLESYTAQKMKVSMKNFFSKLFFSCKISIITVRSNEAENELTYICNIKLKRHNILPTRTSIFVSNAEKNETMQEFSVKFFK